MMAAVVVISVPLMLLLIIRKRSCQAYPEEVQKDESIQQNTGILLYPLHRLLLSLTGCHGSKDLSEFEVPEKFDTSQQV